MLNYGVLIIGLSLFGGFFIRIICLRQIDLKMLIAYSSVSHIRLVIGGLIRMNFWGINGMLRMIVAHGFCSSGLFCLANMLYERIRTRRIIYLRGIGYLRFGIIIIWFILCIINIGVPLSIGFFREILILTSLVKFSIINILLLMMIIFFVSGYSLYLFSQLYHGKTFFLFRIKAFRIRERIIIFFHVFPLIFYLLKGDLIIIF